MIKGVFMCLVLLLSQSCAVLTSLKPLKLERGEKTSFQTTQVYTDNFGHTLIFFEDGSLLSIENLSPENVVEYLETHNYKIYKKFDDHRFNWGVYQSDNDKITIELHEKVHQWGTIKVCQWNGVIKENNLEILPIKRKLKPELDFYTFTTKGKLFKNAPNFVEATRINPKQAWVNK